MIVNDSWNYHRLSSTIMTVWTGLNHLGEFLFWWRNFYWGEKIEKILIRFLEFPSVKFLKIWQRSYSLLAFLAFNLSEKFVRQGALTIRPKISKFSKRGQMVRKIPEKSSRKSGNCWISEKRTIQPKIPEIPWWNSNGMEISRKKVSKIWVYLTWLSSFSEFMQIPNFLLSAS